MDTVENRIEIRRPVETVFAFVADGHNNPQWQEAFKEVQVTPDGPPMVGTKMKAVASFLGVKFEPTAEITALEPNRSFSFKGTSGPATIEGTFRFEPAGEGTLVSSSFQVEPGGLFKVAGSIFASQFKKQTDADLQRLKAILEAQA
jgi:uncharacterized membrane protein